MKSIQVIEYAPKLFRDIRKASGISSIFFLKSFLPALNFQAIHNFFTGTGKSSSLFFFTDNKFFVLKTLKEEEKTLLLNKGILNNYFNHLMINKNSLLGRYYGVYTIKVPSMGDLHFIIMNNIIGLDFMSTFRIYDLKGSTFKRKVQLSNLE